MLLSFDRRSVAQRANDEKQKSSTATTKDATKKKTRYEDDPTYIDKEEDDDAHAPMSRRKVSKCKEFDVVVGIVYSV